MNKKPVTPDIALSRLQDLCARSEQCSYDLRRKLFNWGVGADASEKIIDRLIAEKFVDDERFSIAFARDKYRFSGWGKLKILAHLAAKRIPKSVAETALDEIDAEEYAEVALKTLKAKARALKEGNTYEGRTKLFRFGVTRGFETSLVSSLIKSGAVWE
ncbi:MAG: RecX family transcriptional regulator [Paramuribaculum sp.]|nr:RecX family transcriptional regulator [Paramuribaculum sp.]